MALAFQGSTSSISTEVLLGGATDIQVCGGKLDLFSVDSQIPKYRFPLFSESRAFLHNLL